MQAHSLADWSAFLMLGVSGYAAFSAPYFLLVDADLKDFDPRPVLARAVAVVHQDLVHAGHNVAWAVASTRHEFTPAVVPVRHAAYVVRELARDVAALVLLLTTSPKGATRV